MLKENIQYKKGKPERSNTRPNSSKPEDFQRNSPKRVQSRPNETTGERLDPNPNFLN